MDKNTTDNRIQKTLDSLDGIERASPGPFFFTRLQVRLNHQARQARNLWDEVSSFLTRPVVALGGILIIAIINISLIYSTNSDSTDTSQYEYAASDEYVQLSNSVYEIENIKP